MKEYAQRKIRIYEFDDFEFIDSGHGFSLYRGILVLWDEDRDTRILSMIDGMEDKDREQLVIAQEHEGTLVLLWKKYIPSKYGVDGMVTNTQDGDVWGIVESEVI